MNKDTLASSEDSREVQAPSSGQAHLFRSTEVRPAADLFRSALAVIDAGFAAGAKSMLPLFSSGHDSLCACYIASKHPRFDGEMHHINTGIGARASRAFAEEVCAEFNWKLNVY